MLDRTVQPPIKTLEDFSIQSPQRLVLANGVPLNVLNIGDNAIVRVDFVFEAGRWQQHQPLQALFTNNMLREGTQSLSAAQIAEKLDFYGAWLDLSVSSHHAFVTLYTLQKYLPPTLDVLQSMLFEPVFPEKELGIVVATNLQQYLMSQKKTDVLARRLLLKTLYGTEHPFGWQVTPDDYLRITSEVVHRFFQKFYRKGECAIFLSGCVTEQCVQMIASRFGNESFIDQSLSSSVEKRVTITDSQKQFFVEQPDASQSSVLMGMLSLGSSHPDFLGLRVLLTLFGGYFGSRLMSNIREEKGYTYSIAAGIAPDTDNSLLLIQAETAPEYVRPLIVEVYREIDRVQQDLVSEEELNLVKNYMIGDMCRNYESAFSVSDAWIFAHTLQLPDTHFSDFFHVIKRITPAQIRSLAQQYLCKENLKEVVSGKKMV